MAVVVKDRSSKVDKIHVMRVSTYYMYQGQQNFLYPKRGKQVKDLPSMIGCELIRSFKKLLSQNSPPMR